MTGRDNDRTITDDDEQPQREPVPRSWREEFDGLKPIRPHGRKKPAAEKPLSRDDRFPEAGKDDE